MYQTVRAKYNVTEDISNKGEGSDSRCIHCKEKCSEASVGSV
jgi:hypothetical protein